LDKHICYEEQILFPKIQEVATPGQMKKISDLHEETGFVENTDDVFWK